MKKMRVYTASQMTGRTGSELLAQSRSVGFLGYYYRVEVLDPILSENVEDNERPLHNGGSLLRRYWCRDKEMIKEAHVIIDLTGMAKSEGVAHEIGYARYFLYKPVIRVWPNLGSSIARLEDDLIVETMDEAFKLAVIRWGTPWKRLKWRFRLYNRCFANMLLCFINEWRNCIW